MFYDVLITKWCSVNDDNHFFDCDNQCTSMEINFYFLYLIYESKQEPSSEGFNKNLPVCNFSTKILVLIDYYKTK